MADTFKFELVTPERMLMSQDAARVVVPGMEGRFAVLPGHAPVISALRPGMIELTLSDAKTAGAHLRQRRLCRGGCRPRHGARRAGHGMSSSSIRPLHRLRAADGRGRAGSQAASDTARLAARYRRRAVEGAAALVF